MADSLDAMFAGGSPPAATPPADSLDALFAKNHPAPLAVKPKPTFETPKNVRPNPLRQVGDFLSSDVSLFNAWDTSEREKTFGVADQSLMAHPELHQQRLDAWAKAMALLKAGKVDQLNEQYYPWNRNATELRRLKTSAPFEKIPPWLNAAGSFYTEWENPTQKLAGKAVEGALGLARAGFGAARAASPTVNAAATGVEKGVAKVVAPIQEAQRRLGEAAFAKAMDAARGMGYGFRSIVDRYASAKLPQSGGSTFVKAGFAAQAAPLHAQAVIDHKIDEIFKGLDHAQAREVQKHSYVDDETGQHLYQPQPSAAGKVPEPKRGPSLAERGKQVRALIRETDALQAKLGIRSDDPLKQEQMASGIYWPMRIFNKKPVYASQALNEAATRGEDVVIARAGTGRSSYSGAGGQFKASVAHPGRQMNPPITDPYVEEALHPQYDPAYQLREHLREAHRAIANEQQRILLEKVPSINPLTGVQRDYTYTGIGQQPLMARVPPIYSLEHGRDQPLVFGLGEAGAKGQAAYIERQARAKSRERAMQDPAFLAAAAKFGVDPKRAANLVERATAPIRARLSEAGTLQKDAQRFVTGYKNVAARGKAAAEARAAGIAAPRGSLEQAIHSVQRVGSDVGRTTGHLDEQLAANLRAAGEAREGARGAQAAGAAWERDLDQLQPLLPPTKQAILAHARETYDPIAEDWAAHDPGPKSVVPDWKYDRTRPPGQRWHLAGEFENVPRQFLDLSSKPIDDAYDLESATRVGNIDQVATESGHADGNALRAWMETAGRNRPMLKDHLAEAERRIVDSIRAGTPGTLEQLGLSGLSVKEAVAKAQSEAKQMRDLEREFSDEAAKRQFAESELGPAARGAVAAGERATGSLADASDAIKAAHTEFVTDAAKIASIASKGFEKQAAAGDRFLGKVEERPRELKSRLERQLAESRTAAAFKTVAEKYYRTAYDEIEREVLSESPRAPKVDGQEYVMESTLGLGSPSGRSMALAKPFADFFTATQGLNALDKDEASKVLNVWRVLNRLSRLSIVLVPTVHAVNNLGMAYLSEGGDPAQMAAIIARRVKYSDALKERAFASGAVSEHSQQMFSAERGYQSTIPVADRARNFGAKLGPVGKALSPIYGGMLHAEHAYSAMNDWLFRDVEQGYGFDLFDRFTKAGMDDGAAAIRVRNALGRFDNLTPTEMSFILTKIFYFYPWVKTSIPFWAKKGLIDPKWWSAPVRAIQVNNEAQGFDDPSKPFTGTFGKMPSGEYRRMTIPVPQRATQMLANTARIPFDLASAALGKRSGITNAVEDMKAPLDFATGHFSLPFQIAREGYDATRSSGPAPWNMWHTDKNAPGPQQIGQVVGNIVGREFAPAARLSDVAADPLGTLAGFGLGGFSYGVKTAVQKHHEAQVKARISARFHKAIVAATKRGDDDEAARLGERRDAEIRAALAPRSTGNASPPAVGQRRPTLDELFAGGRP